MCESCQSRVTWNNIVMLYFFAYLNLEFESLQDAAYFSILVFISVLVFIEFVFVLVFGFLVCMSIIVQHRVSTYVSAAFKSLYFTSWS